MAKWSIKEQIIFFVRKRTTVINSYEFEHENNRRYDVNCYEIVLIFKQYNYMGIKLSIDIQCTGDETLNVVSNYLESRNGQKRTSDREKINYNSIYRE